MSFDVLIRGGNIVSSQGVNVGDIGISGDKIVAVGSLSGADAAEVIDATGLHVFP